jgi:DNA-binding transcriptional LysR family regulator
MIPDLPTPLLRSLVAVVDCGSLAAAAARMGRSESALSLQMSRLEDIAGQPLFDRDGRSLRLNQAGSRFLGHARAILDRIDAARTDLGPTQARPLRVGVVQDFVETVLSPVLAELRAGEPATSLEIMIGGTADLLRAMGEDRIDTALCVSELRGAGATAFPMRWFGETGLLDHEVLPLVSVARPCPFLEAAEHALDAAGRAWRIAVVTPSLEGARVAVAAGLGVACRTVAGLGLPPLGEDCPLPPLPSIRYSVLERRQGRSSGEPSLASRLSARLALLAKDHTAPHGAATSGEMPPREGPGDA